MHHAQRFAGELGLIDYRATGLEVDSLGPIDVHERFGDQQLARCPIERIGKAVLVEVHQHTAAAAADRQFGKDFLRVRIVVPVVVRRELVGPNQLAIVRTSRQNTRWPLVVAGALLGVVGPGIARAVIDQVQLRVVRQPAPNRRAAALPRVA